MPSTSRFSKCPLPFTVHCQCFVWMSHLSNASRISRLLHSPVFLCSNLYWRIRSLRSLTRKRPHAVVRVFFPSYKYSLNVSYSNSRLFILLLIYPTTFTQPQISLFQFIWPPSPFAKETVLRILLQNCYVWR